MLGFSQSTSTYLPSKKSIPLFPLFYTLYLYTLRQKVLLTKSCVGLYPEVWAGLDLHIGKSRVHEFLVLFITILSSIVVQNNKKEN